MLSILKDKTSPLLPLVDVNFVAELAAGDLSSFNQPWFGQLMSGPQLLAYLVQTEQWLREYKVSIL
jgi:asparagine synthase (glutamine-hydrolysing)